MVRYFRLCLRHSHSIIQYHSLGRSSMGEFLHFACRGQLVELSKRCKRMAKHSTVLPAFVGISAVMRSSQMVSGLLASPILIAFQEMHTVRMAVIRIVIGRTRLIPTKGTHRHKPDNICRLYFHRSDRHQPTLCHDLVGQKGYFTDIKRNVLFIPVTSAHRNNFQPQSCTCPQNQCKFSIAFAKKSPIWCIHRTIVRNQSTQHQHETLPNYGEIQSLANNMR